MKKIIILLSVILLCVIYLPLVFSVNRAANDFPLVQQDVVSSGFNFPQAWSNRGNGIGDNVIFTLWSYPLDFLFGLGSSLGISFTILTKIIFLIPTCLLGIFSMKKLHTRLGVHGIAQLPGILLFLTNSYLLLLIDGGQLSIALAVAWLPAVYCYADEALGGNLRSKIRAGLFFSLLSVFDIRIAYLFAVMFFVRFLFDVSLSKKVRLADTVFSYLKLGSVFGMVWLSLNLYWLIPLLKTGSDAIPSELTSTTQLSFLNFTNLFNGLFLQQPNWPLNSFGQVSLPDWKFIILFLPIVALLFRKTVSKKELYFLVLFLVSVFLTKGSNPPFSALYSFLFNHIPGFFLFRDSTKFLAITGISLSVLLSFAINHIEKTRKWGIHISFLFLLFLSVILRPVLTQKMTGFLAEPLYRSDFEAVSEYLQYDTSFGRILWLPSRPPLGYSSLIHPSVDGLTIAGIRPFSIANVGSYERFNFLREASYSKELLEILGVKYVAYPYYDTRKQNLKPDEIAYYETFSQQLSSANWVDSVIHKAPVNVIKTTAKPSLFRSAKNLWWVVGSDTIYGEFRKIPNFTLENNAIIFTENTKGLLTNYDAHQFGKILTYNKSDNDVLGNFLEPQTIYNPQEVIQNKSGTPYWTVDINNPSSWREFLENKYSLDVVDFGSNKSSLVFENGGTYDLKNPTHANTLLLRVLISPEGGSIFINEKQQIETYSSELGTTVWGITVDPKNPPKEYRNAQFHWFVVNGIDATNSSSIKITGKINAISDVAFVDQSEVKNKLLKIEQLRKNGVLIDFSKMSDHDKNLLLSSKDAETALSVTSQSPTHYSLSSLSNGKQVIIFSQKYDPQWHAGETNSIPVYGLINGFIVNGQTIDIDYGPQKYFSKNLEIAEVLLAIALAAVCIIRPKKRI